MGTNLLNQIIVASAIGVDFWLETHGKPVPATITLIAGFYLRHLIGGDIAKDNNSNNVNVGSNIGKSSDDKL